MSTTSRPRVLLNATDGPLSVRAIQRYVTALARGLSARPDEVELHLLFLTHHRGEVRRFVAGLPGRDRVRVHTIPLPRGLADRRYQRPRFELNRLARKVDLFHETSSDHPALDFDGPYHWTLHGLATEVRPDLCPPEFLVEKRAWFRRALERSSHAIAVSETTRGEFLERFDLPPESVRAVPLGIDERFEPGDPVRSHAAVRTHFGIEGNYLLYVGGVQPNKNIPRLLETARILRERRIFDGALVLAGDLHYDEGAWDALLAAHGMRGHVRHAGYLSPDDPFLADLYRSASVFLFPTYYEGWTSPPLEAMGCGTPVVASSASSVPETVGEAALLADPDDPEAWVQSVERILDDRALRTDLRERGIERARFYSWDRSVEGTLAFYRASLGLSASPPATQPTPAALSDPA